MWKQLRHDSSRSSSSTSVLAAFAQSSPTASVRSSKSIQPSQQPSELKDLQELLNFHKGLVQNLGHDLVEMDKLKYLSLKQESRLDTQQATIERLSSQNTHYKRRVAELETQVREDKARINELITSIKNLRKFNVQSQKSGDHMVPLDGIIKDALIEQFESDVERLTQQVFDHDRETQALVSLHERDVGDLERRIESLRNDLRHEQSVVTMHMRSQAKITKARQAVQQSDLNRQALDSLGKSGGASARDETLTQALAHTKELSRSERLTTDGKEIELHHMQNLCGVAQAQAEEIALLRAANTDLLAANTMQEEKEDQVKTSIADVHPPAHRRNVTWDLPLRNTKREVEPRTPSRLRKRWAPSFAHKMRRSLSLSKPASRSTSKDENEIQNRMQFAAAQSAASQHLRETPALQRLISSTTGGDGILGMTSEQITQAADRLQEKYVLVRDSGLGGLGGSVEELDMVLCGGEAGETDAGRVRSPEEVRAEQYLFGDIPMVF